MCDGGGDDEKTYTTRVHVVPHSRSNRMRSCIRHDGGGVIKIEREATVRVSVCVWMERQRLMTASALAFSVCYMCPYAVCGVVAAYMADA